MPAPPLSLLRTQSDERLVELARAGHERAFEAIVQRYRRPLLRACRRYLPEARAEDALQQALLAAWTALQRGDEVRELRPWLYRIAHNTSLNTVRMSGYDHAELADSLRATDAPDEELERRAIVRQTLAGVAALPERQREALLRMALEGAGAEEVARDLGLSTGAVRQLVHRARMTLRAAATAITPLPLAGWAAGASGAGDGFAQRIAELCAPAATAGAGATVAKVGAVAVLAGGAVAGPVAVHHDAATDRARAATVRQRRPGPRRGPTARPPPSPADAPERSAPRGRAPRWPARRGAATTRAGTAAAAGATMTAAATAVAAAAAAPADPARAAGARAARTVPARAAAAAAATTATRPARAVRGRPARARAAPAPAAPGRGRGRAPARSRAPVTRGPGARVQVAPARADPARAARTTTASTPPAPGAPARARAPARAPAATIACSRGPGRARRGAAASRPTRRIWTTDDFSA